MRAPRPPACLPACLPRELCSAIAGSFNYRFLSLTTGEIWVRCNCAVPVHGGSRQLGWALSQRHLCSLTSAGSL